MVSEENEHTAMCIVEIWPSIVMRYRSHTSGWCFSIQREATF